MTDSTDYEKWIQIEHMLVNLKVFSPLHQKYIESVIYRAIEYYGDLLVGFAIFGSYARKENRKNSDLDMLIILKNVQGFSKRIKEFVDNVELKCEMIAQQLYEKEEIHCELSPYILSREEALKLQPIYYDFVAHHIIIYDPEKTISRIIESTRNILTKSRAKKIMHGNVYEWDLKEFGFLGGVEL